MSDEEDLLLAGKLKPLSLFGGMTVADLWPTNNVALITFGLLIFAPRWKWTPTLTLIGPTISSIIYAGCLISLMTLPPNPDDIDGSVADFTSLAGIVKLFRDPNGVFVGWVHYVAFDALVGRMVALDSVQRGASTFIHIVMIVPILCFVLMFGPVGFLLYMILREIVLPIKTTTTTSKEDDDSSLYKAKIL